MCFKHQVNRRSFLKTLMQGSTALAAGQFLRPLGSDLAYAAGEGPSNMKLVVMDYGGGLTLNFAPGTAGFFRDNFATTYPNNPLPITGDQALHPALTGFKTAWDAGELIVLNQVGTPAYSRSHDRAQEIFKQALLNTASGQASGLGTRFSAIADRSRFSVVSTVGPDDFISNPRSNPPVSIRDLGSLGINRFRYNSNVSRFMSLTHNQNRLLAGAAQTGSEGILKNAQDKTEVTLGTLASLAGQPTAVGFPNTGVGRALRDAAKLFTHIPGVRVVYVRQGGYDTHANEDTRLPQLLGQANAAYTAFRAEAIAQGFWNDTVFYTMSEFGRTSRENGSNGTDHGHAGIQTVSGGAVRGGRTIGNTPSSAELNASYYLRSYQVDHFNVLYNIFRDHMGVTNLGALFPEGGSFSNLFLKA